MTDGENSTESGMNTVSRNPQPKIQSSDEYWKSTARQCKICFEDDIGEMDENNKWISPCKCDGSIKWVHENCFKRWLKQAPFPQQSACSTCRFSYRKTWRLKPISDWCWPNLNLNFWDVVEISLDIYSTIKMLRGFWHTVQGKRSLVAQFCYFFFWKTFIFTDRRTLFYKSLGTLAISSILEPQVRDAKDDEKPEKFVD